MGKIFGISDLPVTIFTTPLEPVHVPRHPAEWHSVNIHANNDVMALKFRSCKNGFVSKIMDKIFSGSLKILKKL